MDVYFTSVSADITLALYVNVTCFRQFNQHVKSQYITSYHRSTVHVYMCVVQPATVSRCGMIYLEPSTLGWHPMLKSWVNTLPQPLQTDENRGVVMAIFEWLVDPCFTFVKKSCKVRRVYHGFHSFVL